MVGLITMLLLEGKWMERFNCSSDWWNTFKGKNNCYCYWSLCWCIFLFRFLSVSNAGTHVTRILLNILIETQSYDNGLSPLPMQKSLFKIVLWYPIFICYPISQIFAAHFTTRLMLNIGKKIFYLIIYKLKIMRGNAFSDDSFSTFACSFSFSKYVSKGVKFSFAYIFPMFNNNIPCG